MALTQDAGRCNYGRKIPFTTWDAAANQVFFQGSIVIVKTDGFAYVGVTGTSQKVIGIACVGLNTTGLADADKSVIVDPGTWGDFTNSASTDAIATDDRGKTCYVVDDDTVALTDGGSTRSAAGTVFDVADDGTSVVVQFEVIR
jgi:hypothetical protein